MIKSGLWVMLNFHWDGCFNGSWGNQDLHLYAIILYADVSNLTYVSLKTGVRSKINMREEVRTTNTFSAQQLLVV